jgi:hypothetical protein
MLIVSPVFPKSPPENVNFLSSRKRIEHQKALRKEPIIEKTTYDIQPRRFNVAFNGFLGMQQRRATA